MSETETKIEFFKTEENYRDFMNLMSSMVKQICLMPLEKYIKKYNIADTIGPFLDPTLWMKAHKSANKWNDLAKDLNVIKQKYKDMVFHDKSKN